jgi:monovalent cation:H+ antiporter-2, CPA2 family
MVQPLARRLPSRVTEQPGEPPDRASDAPHRAIVVGYGPVGRMLVRSLRENGVEPVVLELNLDTVKELRTSGTPVIYGDASQQQVLEAAGIERARSLVFACSGSPDAIVRQATALNPRMLILTRTTYVREARALREAGANVVVAAEAEVALAMTEHLLRHLGATADQLDRARDRVRNEIG